MTPVVKDGSIAVPIATLCPAGKAYWNGTISGSVLVCAIAIAFFDGTDAIGKYPPAVVPIPAT